jgi:hypothetical protein
MKKNVLLLIGLALVSGVLSAGEYSPVSVGFGLEAGFPITKQSYAIQTGFTTSTPNLTYGVSIPFQVRLGQIFTMKLNSFTLQPTVGFRFGSTKEGGSGVFDNGVSVVDGATFTTKTKVKEGYFALPLRYYAVETAPYGGFYLEAGPIWVSRSNEVSATGNGFIGGIAAPINTSATFTEHKNGYIVGLGWTTIGESSQRHYGITYEAFSANNGAQTSVPSTLKLSISWTF